MEKGNLGATNHEADSLGKRGVSSAMEFVGDHIFAAFFPLSLFQLITIPHHSFDILLHL